MTNTFAEQIRYLYDNHEVVRKRIPSVDDALEALQELDNMIGMDDLKKQIKDCIKTHLADLISSNTSKKGRQHGILSGGPGVGKTTFAKAIAKVLVRFGYITTTSSSSSLLSGYGNYLINSNLSTSLVVLPIYIIFGKPEERKRNLYFFLVLFVITIGLYLFDRFWKSSPANQSGEFFVVVKREDLVDRYVGGTAPRAKEFLSRCVGKIVFVDEAYKIITGQSFDNYGKEALTVLLEFMDEHEEDTLFLFGGYREQMDEGIFSVNPGLKRRFTNIFDLPGYTPNELQEIFRSQLASYDLVLHDDCTELFVKNKDSFQFFGGDTDRLANYVNTMNKSTDFENLFNKNTSSREVTYEMVKKAIRQLSKINTPTKPPTSDLERIISAISKKE
jgi:SpoVK/Ycf46/Vps4 family AAA+-type ATPase